MMRGRRQNPRNLCADLLKIRWLDEDGEAHREYATLEDISEGGLCLRMESAIRPGSWILVRYPRGKYEGMVKYCLHEIESHVIGVEFLPGYRWSRRQYDPPHLLQFRLRLVEDAERRSGLGRRASQDLRSKVSTHQSNHRGTKTRRQV